MPKLYLVRHAEPAALWGSHPDPGLSPLGLTQADLVATHLSGLGAKSIITSPLARCRETAAPCEVLLGVTALINNAVAEIPVPKGVTDHRAWLMAVMGGDWGDDVVGQGLIDWRQNIARALLEMTQDTIVFSHFVAINAAVSIATASDRVTVFKPGHASVTILDSDTGVLKLVELGQESAIHLA
jgi:broad specificity phosphatase PhoE